jgi:hypothetical protein
LDWIDQYPSCAVDEEFCDWLADHFQSPRPRTRNVIAADPDGMIELVIWNTAFARVMITGETDRIDGMFGGDSATEKIVCYPSSMTQRQAWNMFAFFRSALRENDIVAECVAVPSS